MSISEMLQMLTVVDGKAQSLAVPLVIVHGRTLLPIRVVIETLGGSAIWDPVRRRILLSLGTHFVTLIVGSTKADVDGSTVALDVSPMITNGRTLVLLRFVAENLGLQVTWDASTRTVTVTN
jgi:hypothetical protein